MTLYQNFDCSQTCETCGKCEKCKNEYAFGTTSGDTDLISWTNIGLDTSVTITGLDLTHDATYYGSVRASDNVGHVSVVALSDGILVDVFEPTVGIPNDGGDTHGDLDYQGPSDTLAINWEKKQVRLNLLNLRNKNLFSCELHLKLSFHP